MGLLRRYQLFAALEDIRGVNVSTILDPGNANLLIGEPEISYDPEEVTRNINRGTLTKETSLPGLAECTATFQTELSGSVAGGADAGKPPWGRLMRACGFDEDQFYAAVISTSFTAGTYLLHGEVVTGAVTGTTGLVVHDVHEGQGILRYERTSGPGFNGSEVITGATSGNSVASAGSDVLAGRYWSPADRNEAELDISSTAGDCTAGTVWKGATSGAIVVALADHFTAGSPTSVAGARFELLTPTPPTDGETFADVTDGANTFVYDAATITMAVWPTATLALVEDGRIKLMRGAMGSFSIEAETARPAIVNWEFTGVLYDIQDGVKIDGTTFDSPKPPRFLCADFQVGEQASDYTEEVVPLVSQFSVDAGVERAYVDDPTDTQGRLYSTIVDRAPVTSFDPEVMPEAFFPWIARLRDGVPVRWRAKIGTANSNTFRLTAPAMKVQGEGQGDRDGRGVSELDFSLSGELPDGSSGERNELVLSYETTGASW